MKNILVLTDFSAAAGRAAESALLVGAKLGADVLLVHVYTITPYIPPAALASWPQRRPDEKRRGGTTGLNREARRLEKCLRAVASGHILFATDLAAADEAVIADLVGLAARLKAHISMSHVSRPALIPDFTEEVRTSAFLENMENLYPLIGSYPVRDVRIMDALGKLSKEKHVDLMLFPGKNVGHEQF